MQNSIFLADEAATLAFAARYAHCLQAPLVVYLQGDLGAGKTTFTRGLLRALGYQGTVKSPTYAIVESYHLPQLQVHHFDLYRFSLPEEWEDAGLDELFTPDSLCLIEWAMLGGEFVPKADLIFEFSVLEQGRRCTVSALTAQGQRSLDLCQD